MSVRPKFLFLTAAVLLLAAPFSHAERTVLNKDEAKLSTSRFSIGGPLDQTQLLYTFGAQRVVLSIHIRAAGDAHQVSGKVFIFDPDLPEEDLRKWLNNNSLGACALHPDVPEPVLAFDLPEDAFTITDVEFINEQRFERGNLNYKDFGLTLKVSAQRIADLFELGGFEEQTGIYIVPPR